MKTKILFTILCTTSVIFSLSSCKDHDHSWENYLIKSPTCAEAGQLEQLCKECGEKIYVDVAKSEHNYVNGICSICGNLESPESTIVRVSMPENSNNQAVWDMSKIYKTSKTFSFSGNYSAFLSYFSNVSLEDIYIDTLGLFHITANVNEKNGSTFKIPLALIIAKVSPIGEGVTLTVSNVSFENDSLLITYHNGLQLSAGNFSSSNSRPNIIGFGLNTDNQLVIYYSDETISFAGKLSTKTPPENQSNIVYRATEGGYEIHSVLDEGQLIKIPPSHQGISIERIGKKAFSKISDTVKFIVIPEGVKVSPETFSGLNSNTIIFLEGKKSDHNFSSINSNLKVYEQGEWSYVNGVPTVK